MTGQHTRRIGILTSGGDAPGMNAAVRAVAYRARPRHGRVCDLRGLPGHGRRRQPGRKLGWDSVSGILHRGGTVIGTARCLAFRDRAGRLQAARNLLEHEIDSLVVIGGDGSLTGANLFRQEWPSLLSELVEQGLLAPEVATRRAHLAIVGLVGSIDNDMAGTDMTIGADTALRTASPRRSMRSPSTAASHQRTFIVEVMGRHCGYLALMGAIATGADWAFIPENPPNDR
ncbi:MAG: 6-phosphofructokinase [Kouleothrix sp.]